MGALHARVVTQSQDAELAVVVDPDVARGEEVASRFRTRWQPDLDDLARLDAVVIATPTDTHVTWARRALAADVPVLVEKPLADDAAAVEALVEEARRADVPLLCGLLERFNPAVRTALSIIQEPVHVTTARHSPFAPRIVTGVAHDLLIHDADLALRVAGELPDAVSANFVYCHPDAAPGEEDVAEVSLQFPRLLAALSVSRVSQRKIRTLAISELTRLVEVDLLRQDVTVYRHVGNELDEGGIGYRQQTIIDIPTIQNAREPLASQLDHFVSLARGEGDHRAELATVAGPHLVVAQAAEAARRASSPRLVGGPVG